MTGPALLAVAALSVGCTATAAPRAAQPSAPLEPSPQAGRYPVATPPPQILATPTVAPGQYQLVAAGVPVRALLGAGITAVVAALGPDVGLPPPAAGAAPPSSAPGVLTIQVTAEQGTVTVTASQLLLLDEQHRPVSVRAQPAAATATADRPASLTIAATLAAGHTTLTWQPQGRPLVTWDFVVELD